MKRYPDFLKLAAVLTMVVFIGVGCASWELLTPDQKARAIVDGMQLQLNDLFDQGKAYVDAHPEHLEVWQTEIIPVFDMANKAIADVIELAKLEQIGPRDVESKIVPFLNRVLMHLDKIGVFD